MELYIETKDRLPYALRPNPAYTPAMLSNILTKWTRYLATGEGWSADIAVTPDPKEADQTENHDDIGKAFWISFQDIRSILIMA